MRILTGQYIFITNACAEQCTDLPKECSGGLSGLLDSIKGTGAGDQKEGMKGALGTFAGELQKDPECITKVKSCFGKVRQDLGAALHKPAPTGAM